jgi:hypothetical protein
MRPLPTSTMPTKKPHPTYGPNSGDRTTAKPKPEAPARVEKDVEIYREWEYRSNWRGLQQAFARGDISRETFERVKAVFRASLESDD